MALEFSGGLFGRSDSRDQDFLNGATYPRPSGTQTIITKSAAAATSYATIHTVTADKKFFLMGFACHSTDDSFAWSLSLDGGSTVAFYVKGGRGATGVQTYWNIRDVFPMAELAAGTVIQIKCSDAAAADFFTIWGWEE